MSQFIYFKVPQLKDKYVGDIWDRFNYLPDTAGVYLLTETDLNVRYVGSSMNVRSRAISYIHPSSVNFRKCLFNHLNTRFIKIELLENCIGNSIEYVRKVEGYWIEKLNTIYPNGLNNAAPSKGSAKVDKHLYNSIRNKPILPCEQLLNFSRRLSFYLDAVEATPINKNWNPHRFARKAS